MQSTGGTPFSVRHTEIPDLVVLRTKRIGDERGTIHELFRSSAMAEAGLAVRPWTQVNLIASRRGSIRGLHAEEVTKLISVVGGEALGAYVDARADSPALGRTVTVPLRLGTEVLVPPGVCIGFQATGPAETHYLYCLDREFAPGAYGVTVNPLDPGLGISWPIPVDPGDRSLLSARDAAQPSLAEALAGVMAEVSAAGGRDRAR